MGLWLQGRPHQPPRMLIPTVRAWQHLHGSTSATSRLAPSLRIFMLKCETGFHEHYSSESGPKSKPSSRSRWVSASKATLASPKGCLFLRSGPAETCMLQRLRPPGSPFGPKLPFIIEGEFRFMTLPKKFGSSGSCVANRGGAEEENATSAKPSPSNVLIGGPASKLWIPDRSIRE